MIICIFAQKNMKNIICPVSSEKIPEHLPRVTAFLNISLMIIFFYTNSSLLLAFLVSDFFIRGFNYPQFSIINFTAKKLSLALNLSSSKIDKAPKLFAARLGGLMFIIALVLNLTGSFFIASIIVFMVAILSTLECVFNFCVGCYFYNYLIFPFYSK